MTAPSTSSTLLDVRPLTGHTGAEIHGVDLREPLAPEVVAEIRATLLRWKVVFFRDQAITQAQQIAFGRLFGEVTPAHPTLPAEFPDHPEILLLDSRRTDERGGPRYENRWHTDVTFVPNPPMGTILRGVVVPPYGGDTQFTNLAAAYAGLSPELRDLVDRLHAVHQNVLPLERGEEPSEYGTTFASTPIRTAHPVVRVHPETGERVLFVNPLFTDYIVELSRRESRHLLALLFEQISLPAYTARFRWEPDSIAFWDNRATAHLIPTDTPPEFHRSMQRITLAGDIPIGADGQPSRVISGESFA